MKKNLNVKNAIVRIEKAIQDCGKLTCECPKCQMRFERDGQTVATKVAVGLAHNLKAMREPLASARETLVNTPAIDAFNRAVQEMNERMGTKTEGERMEAFAALKLKHKKAQDDLEELRLRDKETGDMNFDIEIYRIPLTHLPGWYSDADEDQVDVEAKNEAVSIPFSSLQVLIEFGILYDPEVEDREGNPVKKEEEKPEDTKPKKAKK